MSRRPRMLRSPAARGLAAWLLAGLVVAPPGLPAAQAAPEGEKVVHGEASFARDGSLTVIRPSDGAIIEYTRFDILRHEAVRFEQPSETARVLNRISGDPSRIDGALRANGIVYLVNPAGVFFGRDAVVQVGRLVAAAGDLPDRDFLRGVDAFALSGPLENLGSLEASAVSLLGRSVANGGSIVAPDGVIALVAGERVVLTQLEGGIAVVVEGPAQGADSGIAQSASGSIDAGAGAVRFAVGDHYSLAINHEGVTRGRDIELAGGEGGLVRVAGTLDASAPEPGATGGSVRVTGELVALEGARLDASGAAGGGEIRVGGDLRGAGPLRNARRTYVDADSALRADAQESGDGGSAVVFAEEAAGFFGSISARGGAAGGDGGFAELSSNGLLMDEGRVDVRAPAGAAGTLLYDPRDIVLVGGTQDGDGSDLPNTSPDSVAGDGGSAGQILFADVGDGSEPFAIHESELEGTDASIVLEARNSITASGTFDHDAGGEGAGVVAIRTGNDLTLRTSNQPGEDTGSTSAPGIDLTGSTHGAALELRTAGDGTITLETGTGASDGPEAAIAAGILTTSGSRVSLTTEDGSISVARITSSGADGGTGSNGGDILIDAGDEDGSGDTTLLVTGDLTARGGNGTSGSGGNGGFVGARTRPKPLPTPAPDPLPPAVGGGPVTVLGDIDASGGDGPAGGGAGGAVVLLSAVQGDVSAAQIRSRGGHALDPGAASNGGGGGVVELSTGAGNIAVGAVDSSGGDTDGSQTEFGGDAGDIRIIAGTEPDSSGGVLLEGRLTARGGAGPVDREGNGGNIEIRAADAIEHDGDAGPHIVMSGKRPTSINAPTLTLAAGTDVGAAGALEVDGGGELENFLELEAAGVGQVAVTNPGFSSMTLHSKSAASNIDVTQGGDEIRVDGGSIGQVDTTDLHPDVTVIVQDALFDEDDVAFDLVAPTGRIVAGGGLDLQGEDDVVLGDGPGVVIAARLDPNTGDPDAGIPATAANLAIFADRDGDGTGAIRSGGGLIDRQGDASAPGVLDLDAATGIGEPGDPILMQGGGLLAAVNRESGGIHLRNDADADAEADDLVIGEVLTRGVRVLDGPGDIVLENAAGGVVIEENVSTSGDDNDLGGAVTLGAAPGSAVVLAQPGGGVVVNANGTLTFDGDVTLMEDSQVASRQGDVVFGGAIDTDAARDDRVRSLVVAAREADEAASVTAGAIHLAGDVGIANDLRDLALLGDVVLEGGARQIHTTNTLGFGGDIRAATDGVDSLAILAGPRVEFLGDVGVGGRLASLSIARNDAPPFAVPLPDPFVLFAAEGPQEVRTGAGGIEILPAGLAAVPDQATIAKLDGDLRLESLGAGGFVNLGPNEKLTVQGAVDVVGETVHLGDVSALELHVDSPDARVRARPAGSVLLPGGGRAEDSGTDLIANAVSFSSAPTVEGSGPAPRIATRGGVATNPGALEVVSFEGSLSAGILASGPTVFDLAILPLALPNETPQRAPWVEGLVRPRPSGDEASGSALPPGAQETLAYLRCSAEERDPCFAAPASPLDSPRGAGLARDAARFFGDSAEARELRAALARLEPGALRQLAVFLTEIRLLGLSDSEYQAVRDALYGEILADRGPAAPDARAFAAAVEAQSRGVPL